VPLTGGPRIRRPGPRAPRADDLRWRGRRDRGPASVGRTRPDRDPPGRGARL